MKFDAFTIEKERKEIAEGVRFSDGTTVIRWTHLLVTTSYASMEDVLAYHIDGDKETKLVLEDTKASSFHRGYFDALMDDMENAPFGSVGGLEARQELKAPKYVEPDDVKNYLEGYRFSVRMHYGPDWRTCPFGWSHAMTIGGEDS